MPWLSTEDSSRTDSFDSLTPAEHGVPRRIQDAGSERQYQNAMEALRRDSGAMPGSVEGAFRIGAEIRTPRGGPSAFPETEWPVEGGGWCRSLRYLGECHEGSGHC